MSKSDIMEVRMEGGIKTISLDLEGCVFESGGGRVPWPLQKILKLAQLLLRLYQETGIWFVVNSGRQAPYIEAVLQCLGIVTDFPSICENGSLLYRPLSKQFKINPAITPEKLAKFLKIREKLIKFTEMVGATRELGKEFSLSVDPPEGMSVEALYHRIEELNVIEKKVVEITHSQSAVDITISGVNKESGLEFFAEETGISFKEMAAVGDSRGDWPVLKKVALPLAPVNATPEIRELVNKKGGYVSLYPTTQGVIDCIGQVTKNFRVKALAERFIEEISLNIPIEHTTSFSLPGRK